MTYSPMTLSILKDIRAKLSLPISEGTSVTIKRAIIQLTRYLKDGRNRPEEMLAYIPSISNQLNCAMYSERNKLSSSVVDLITALSARLGPSFEPLISLFIPTLLWFCTQPNTAFTREVKRCLLALIRNTKIKSLLPYIAHLDTSASLRLVAAEAILACLNSKSFEPPNLDNDTRAYLVEDVIKLTTRDGCAKVRRAGKEIFGVYKIVFPERIERFIEALPPAAKEDLTSPLTPVEITCDNPTEGGVGPAVSLQAKKNTSVKQTERQVRPLGSKLPRVIAAPKQAAATRQTTLHPPSDSCSTPKRRNERSSPACPSVPVTQNLYDDKLHNGERTRISLVHATASPGTDSTETALTQGISRPLLKPSSAGKPQITKDGPKRNATKIPVVRMKIQPFTKGEHTTMGDSSSRIAKRRSDAPPSTETKVKTSLQTCRNEKVLRWQGKIAAGEKPVQGGPVIDGPKSIVKSNKKVVDERKLARGEPVANISKSVAKLSKNVMDERKLMRGGLVTDGPKPIIKAPPTNLKRCDTEKLESGKPTPKKPLPSRTTCHVQRAPWRPLKECP